MSTHTSAYVVPDNPADPESAALELIVRMPAEILHTEAFTDALLRYCSALHAESLSQHVLSLIFNLAGA
jgi:hypothetical protein